MAQIPKQLTPIGTIERIDFPDDAIFNVPAKIDTGADYSAIWASNIRLLDDDKLEFTFFGPGSPLYDVTKVVKTGTFKVARVKNSFGNVELRYKVKIRVRIGTKRLVRWCSLADRSRNAFPVLLGKNFLKNVFMVDVSQRHIASGANVANTVLVLAIKDNKSLLKKVAKHMSQPTDFTCASYDELIYMINGLDTMVAYNTTPIPIDIASFDMVYFKSHNNASELAAAAAEYLAFRSRSFFDKEILGYTSMSKLSEYIKLSCGGVQVPRTVCASLAYLRTHFGELQETLGLPFVLKEANSDKGKNNFLVSSEADFISVLSKALPRQCYLAQRFVPNDGFFRLYVMGKSVGLAVWRASHPHVERLKVHLNKPTGGVNASKVELDKIPKTALELAVRAATCMNRQVAGVDLVQDKRTNEWYVLEVNNAPQLRTGSYLSEKAAMLAELFDKELNR